MALLFCDSFDYYPNADLPLKWTSVGGMTISASGRNGQGITHSGDSGSESIAKDLPSGDDEGVIGFAWRGSTVTSRTLFHLNEGAGITHLIVQTDASGKIVITRNGTVIGSAGPTTLVINTWYYIELKFRIHDTLGTIEVQLNGVTEIAETTGLDTRNGGTGVVNRIHYSGQGSYTSIVDDVYFCDGADSGIAGAPNNDFLGDVRIQALLPNGNGNSSQMTGSDGNSTDNYLLVDDPTNDSDATYVESATVGHKDTYAMGNLTPTAGTVYGVQVVATARKTDAGARQIVLVGRDSDGGTEDDSAAMTLSTGYLQFAEIRQADPDGAQWTVAEVNASEFGVKVAA